MRFVDFSMSVLFLATAFMALSAGLWLANEIYLCRYSDSQQSAYIQGYEDGLIELGSDNPFE